MIKKPKILIIGVGNTGNKVVSRLNEIKNYYITTIAIDTNMEDLSSINSDKNILIEKKSFSNISIINHNQADCGLFNEIEGKIKYNLQIK